MSDAPATHRDPSPHVLLVPAWWPSPEQPTAGVFNVDLARALAAGGMRVGVIFPDLVSLRHLRRGAGYSGIPALLRPRVTIEELPASVAGSSPEPARSGSPAIAYAEGAERGSAKRVTGVRVRGLHTALGSPRRHMRGFHRRLRRGWFEYVARHGRPDLLHALCAIPAGWAALALRDEIAFEPAAAPGPTAPGGTSRRMPVLITEHTGPFALALNPPAAGAMTRSALARADALAAVSSHLASQMRAAGIDRPIEIVGNPLGDEWTFRPPPPRERDTGNRTVIHIAFVGRLTVEKGLRELAASAARLAESPRWLFHWHLVGDGLLRGELDRFFVSLAGCAVATFHGERPRESVREVVAAAHLLALPSHGETFGMAAAEALALGRPVVATRGTAVEWLIGPEDGALVDRGDTAGLAEAILRIVDRYDAWDFAAISRRARQRCSADSIARDYLALYRRLLA